MKNNGKVRISFRAATVRERVMTRKRHRTREWTSHPLAHARGPAWVGLRFGASGA